MGLLVKLKLLLSKASAAFDGTDPAGLGDTKPKTLGLAMYTRGGGGEGGVETLETYGSLKNNITDCPGPQTAKMGGKR